MHDEGSGGAHTSRQSRSREPAVLSEPRTAITQLTRLRWVSGLPLATRCPRGSGAAAVRIPITPGWDLRPGADLPHFDRLIR